MRGPTRCPVVPNVGDAGCRFGQDTRQVRSGFRTQGAATNAWYGTSVQSGPEGPTGHSGHAPATAGHDRPIRTVAVRPIGMVMAGDVSKVHTRMPHRRGADPAGARAATHRAKPHRALRPRGQAPSFHADRQTITRSCKSEPLAVQKLGPAPVRRPPGPLPLRGFNVRKTQPIEP
jgi:hypothetical protein